MYKITMEWDGIKPPTTFYNRLRRLGISVRGNKDLSPIERRINPAGTAVVVQEGSYLCKSESLARTIFQWGRDLGARNVQLEEAYEIEYRMTVEDAEIYHRLEESLGKRGRPSGPKMDWVVTCLEECQTYAVPNEHTVVACPNCKGLKIKARVGEPSSFKFPEKGTMLERWFRHRFATGTYEVPGDDTVEPPSKSKISVNIEREKKALELIEGSPDFISLLGKFSDKLASHVLDAVFSARAYMSVQSRRDARVRACIELYDNGVSPDDAQIVENPNQAELLDAAVVIGHQQLLALWQKAYQKQGEPNNE